MCIYLSKDLARLPGKGLEGAFTKPIFCDRQQIKTAIVTRANGQLSLLQTIMGLVDMHGTQLWAIIANGDHGLIAQIEDLGYRTRKTVGKGVPFLFVFSKEEIIEPGILCFLDSGTGQFLGKPISGNKMPSFFCFLLGEGKNEYCRFKFTLNDFQF